VSAPRLRILASVLLLLAAGAAAAGELEDSLRARWEGRWVVLRTAVHSDCLACYASNRLDASGVISDGVRRFEPGELGQVRSLRLRRSTLEVDIDLAAAVRVSAPYSGFVLSRERACGVRLAIEVPREEIRAREADSLNDRLAAVAEVFATADAAHASDSWNGRRVEPLPADHEETVAEYLAWREGWAAEARVRAPRVARAALPDWENDDYLDGFASAIESVRADDWGDCAELTELPLPEEPEEFRHVGASAAGDRTVGWIDGLAFGGALRLLESLEACRPNEGGEGSP